MANTTAKNNTQDTLKKRVSDLEFENKALASTIEERDAEISNLRNLTIEDCDALKSKIDKLEQENAVLHNEIERRTKELQDSLSLLDLATIQLNLSMELVNKNKESLIKRVQG